MIKKLRNKQFDELQLLMVTDLGCAAALIVEQFLSNTYAV
jgi:hypothetical protein